MDFEALRATPRSETGKGAARKLRSKGLLPAIVYGRKSQARALTLDQKELELILKTEAGSNALIRLMVEGVEESEWPVVMVKELQSDPLLDCNIHTDLIEIDMTAKITVEVPIQITGESPGVTEGGLIDTIQYELELECLPADIPENIVVDISGMNIGDTLTLSDIKVAEGIVLLGNPSDAVISVSAPAAEEEVAVDEEEGEEEGAAEGGETEEASGSE